MKDKLIKTNHKASYYRLRRFATSFALVLGLVAIVAVPVTIKAATDLIDKQNNAGAEIDKNEPDSSENSEPSLLRFV